MMAAAAKHKAVKKRLSVRAAPTSCLKIPLTITVLDAMSAKNITSSNRDRLPSLVVGSIFIPSIIPKNIKKQRLITSVLNISGLEGQGLEPTFGRPETTSFKTSFEE